MQFWKGNLNIVEFFNSINGKNNLLLFSWNSSLSGMESIMASLQAKGLIVSGIYLNGGTGTLQ